MHGSSSDGACLEDVHIGTSPTQIHPQVINASQKGMLGGFLSPWRRGAKGSSTTKDSKTLFEGLSGLSVQAALNQVGQLRALLADPSADVNLRDPDGDRFPLHWAAARGHTACLQMLLKSGAEPRCKDAAGATAAQLATALGQHDARAMLDAWTLSAHYELSGSEQDEVRQATRTPDSGARQSEEDVATIF